MPTHNNTDVEITFESDSDAEKAEIEIRSFGGVSELRFDDSRLDVVATMTTSDVSRIFETLRYAESLRTDPDEKITEALELLEDRYSFFTDEDPSRMSLAINMIMPVASCGSVLLEPNVPVIEA